jgi:hypothetical protein
MGASTSIAGRLETKLTESAEVIRKTNTMGRRIASLKIRTRKEQSPVTEDKQQSPTKTKYYVAIDAEDGAGTPCVGIPVAKDVDLPPRNPFSRVPKQTGRILQAASLWDAADEMPSENGIPLKMHLLSETSIWNENN